MRMNFRRVRKLWLAYLFLLFFSFFMFAISINIYLQSMRTNDLRIKHIEEQRKQHEKNPKNIVVAHYIGTGNLFGNISKEEYNAVNFSPMPNEGDNGKPVIIPARESLQMQRLFQINSFNVLASDRIHLNRSLPDYRKKECRVKVYPINLPTTSVIIVFHNEAWSVLLRTLWSVIIRSPRQFLKEIILVDDASDRVYLKENLENYVKSLEVPTRIIRMRERQGLVPARLLGAKEAQGDVLTFLDAHCECSPGWLEPLLARIKQNRNSVVCPVIDIISDDNFSYTKTFEFNTGAFNWQLQFRWFVLQSNQLKRRSEDVTEPFYTPGMAGGLFAIDKEYFFEMGSYDPNMKIWGGENVEMSFRIWQCRGVIEIAPCSHVGHLFRKTSPYTFPGGVQEVLGSNLARVALVWMDRWSDFFFMYNPLNVTLKNGLDVSERKKLREKLQCRSFEWYLANVWPSNFFPGPGRFFGKIQLLNKRTALMNAYEKFILNVVPRKLDTNHNWPTIIAILAKYADDLLNSFDVTTDECLKKIPDNSIYSLALSSVTVGNCFHDAKLQDMFVITPKGQIMTNEGVCLDAYQNPAAESKPSAAVRLTECSENTRQIWNYDLNTQQLRHNLSEMCLTADITNSYNTTIQITKCDQTASGIIQRWAFVPLPWTY